MIEQSQLADEAGPLRHLQYDDGTELLVADLGPGADATVDLVDDTAIVVTDDDHYEVDVPFGGDGQPQAFIRNGVLTIEVNE